MPDKIAGTRSPTRSGRSPFPDGSIPTWEVACFFPPQGAWTEDDYWALDGHHDGFPVAELSNGRLDVLPMPTETHQLILSFLYELLKAFTSLHAPGVVLVAGMRVRLGKGKFRAPDILYMKAEHGQRRHERFWDAADLVMEIVSDDPKDRKRDLETKPVEYARAGIPEYWIIDPEQRRVRVLVLQGKAYKLHGDFAPGSQATSLLLPGFPVSVDQALSPPGSRQTL